MKKFLIFFLFVCLLSCNKKKESDLVQDMHTVNEHIKQKMFNLAYIYDSTAPYYVVAIIKNRNTGEVKEVCTETPFLEGALHGEFEKDYDYTFNLDSATSRYFELSKDSALWNISFDLYTQEELLQYKNTLNLDSIITVLKEKKHSSIQFSSYHIDRKEQIMYAHIMFDYGIMMSRGCVAGNICRLILYDSTKVGIPFLEPDWDYY